MRRRHRSSKSSGATKDPRILAYDKGPAKINVSKYPTEMKAAYKVFDKRCGACHTIARAINSDYVLDDEWQNYIRQMMDRGGTLISADEAKAIYEFLPVRLEDAEEGPVRQEEGRSGGDALRSLQHEHSILHGPANPTAADGTVPRVRSHATPTGALRGAASCMAAIGAMWAGVAAAAAAVVGRAAVAPGLVVREPQWVRATRLDDLETEHPDAGDAPDRPPGRLSRDGGPAGRVPHASPRRARCARCRRPARISAATSRSIGRRSSSSARATTASSTLDGTVVSGPPPAPLQDLADARREPSRARSGVDADVTPTALADWLDDRTGYRIVLRRLDGIRCRGRAGRTRWAARCWCC